MGDNKDGNFKSQILKGCAWFLAGVVLITFVHDFNPKGTSRSSIESSRTYVHEDFRPSPQNYSAPEPNYRPIEIPKPSVPLSLPDIQSPILNAPAQTAPFVEEIIADIPDKPSLDDLESESRQKEFEAEIEIARKNYEAYIEANRERWEAEIQAAQKRLEESRHWHSTGFYSSNDLPAFNEPETVSIPEPEPIQFSHEKPVNSWCSDSFEISP